MTIEDIIPDESAVLELRGQSATEVLAELARALARRSSLDAAWILEQLREREALGSTAVGHALALPHMKAEVAQTYGVLGLARGGVEFAAPDGVPVRVFLAMVSPPQPSEHLQALACVSRTFADLSMLDRIIDLAEPTAIVAVLRNPKAS